MDKQFENIKWVGFDLDGTLYSRTPEIDDRIRTEIAKKLLGIKPDLETIDAARRFFDSEYERGKGMTNVLTDAGYKDAKKLSDKILAETPVADLIEPDEKLTEIVGRLGERYKLFLLTSSPVKASAQKLDKLGIRFGDFTCLVFGDTTGSISKRDGSAFEYLLNQTDTLSCNHVYIGDSVGADMIPATRIGMKTIFVGSNRNYSGVNAQVGKIHGIERLLL